MELRNRSQNVYEEQSEGNGAGCGYDHNTSYTNVIWSKINMYILPHIYTYLKIS